MTKVIHFTKMHGAGNDYIYVDTTRTDLDRPDEAARSWSDRHKGIGADGLVLIGKPADTRKADFSMRIFNADGSEALMCGNAACCIGKFVYEKGMTKQTLVRLETRSGIRTLQLHTDGSGCVESVTVDMGEPSFDDPKLYCPTAEASLLQPSEAPSPKNNAEPVSSHITNGTFVCMGNPHFVIFCDDITTSDVAHWGSILERDKAFPHRCNIEFARLTDTDEIRVRVWERGSGITLACGTGACAAAVAACRTRRTSRNVRVVMDGGTLQVEWNAADNHVYLTGLAAVAFEGDVQTP